MTRATQQLNSAQSPSNRALNQSSDDGAVFIFAMRGNWEFIRLFLRHYNLDGAMSNSRKQTYEKLITELQYLLQTNKISYQKAINEIKRTALSLLILNNKAIYNLNIDAKDIAKINSSITPNTSTDPFSIIDTTGDVAPSNYEPMWINFDGCKICIYPSVKEVSIKTKINKDNYPGLELFDEVVAYETKSSQYFDCFVVSKDKAYLMIDIIDDGKIDYCSDAKLITLKKIKHTLKNIIGITAISTKDIFSLISEICVQDKKPYSELKYSVHEMDFISPELSRYSSSKSHNKPDIRNDAFNEAGLKAAISSLIFYKVSFNINRTHKQIGFPYKMIITIPGTYKRAALGNGSVDYFKSENIMGIDDLKIIDKMIF